MTRLEFMPNYYGGPVVASLHDLNGDIVTVLIRSAMKMKSF